VKLINYPGELYTDHLAVNGRKTRHAI